MSLSDKKDRARHNKTLKFVLKCHTFHHSPVLKTYLKCFFQYMSTRFHESVLEVPVVAVVGNPALARLNYEAQYHNEYITLHNLTTIDISGNPNLVTIDISKW